MIKNPLNRSTADRRPKARQTPVYSGGVGDSWWKPWYAAIFVVMFAVLGTGYLLLHGRAATTSTISALPYPLFTKSPAPWNDPIGTNVQLDPNSAAMVKLVKQRVNVTMSAFGMPMYVSTASDPSCTVSDPNGDPLFEKEQPIHIPANAKAATGDDHWLFVYDTTKHLIFEMWEATKTGSCWQTQTGDVYSPDGDGVLQPDNSTQDGNGASYFGGVVNANDAAHGVIDHALSLASEYTLKDAGRYPMNKQTDGGTGTNHIIPMGARFQLDPSFNCDGMAGAGKGEIMICHALQTYGAYMHDTGGVPASIYFQEDGSAGGVFSAMGLNENSALTHIPWGSLRVLKSWNSYTAVTNPPPPPPATSISSFTAAAASVGYTGDTTLSWSTQNATGCSISSGIGSVSTGGSHGTGALTSDTTFTLTCSGNGTASRQVTVHVTAPGITNFTASPASIAYNADATLSWSVQNAGSCTLAPDVGSVGTSGSRSTGNLTATTTYSLACSGSGTATKQVTVTVAGSPPVSIERFTASPAAIAYNAGSTLSWLVHNANNCSITPGVGSVGTDGERTIGPLTRTTVFTLTCDDRASKQIAVTVAAPREGGGSPSSSGTQTAAGSGYAPGAALSADGSAASQRTVPAVIRTALTPITAVASLAPCDDTPPPAGKNCACTADGNALECAVVRVANPFITVLAAITGFMLLVRAIMAVQTLGAGRYADPLWVRLTRRRLIRLLAALLGCAALYLLLQLVVPGGFLH